MEANLDTSLSDEVGVKVEELFTSSEIELERLESCEEGIDVMIPHPKLEKRENRKILLNVTDG